MRELTWAQTADRLGNEAVAAGEPTAWFEPLYAGAGRGEHELPWDREEPHKLLAQWTAETGIRGDDPGSRTRRAIVPGAGLGKDAELVASLGFETTGFDVSPTAMEVAASRVGGVHFSVGDLFDLPPDWAAGFDLVVEIFTVQAMPSTVREAAVAAVASLVAPGGTLFVIQAGREPGEEIAGPPWPLTETEVTSFARHGLDLASLEDVRDPANAAYRRWRAVFTRPAVA